MSELNEKAICRLLDLDLVIFSGEPELIRFGCLQFFNKASTQTLKKLFDKGLQIDTFEWDIQGDFQTIVNIPVRNLKLILSHMKRLTDM